MDLSQYIDLTDHAVNLADFKITAKSFVCDLINTQTSQKYKGFYFGKSPNGEAMTICDVQFRWSKTDDKYSVRLTFHRVNQKGEDKPVTGGRLVQRIAFDSSKNGYREFWKMIAFLSKFNEVIDTTEFFNEFQVTSRETVIAGLKEKKIDARMAEIMEYVERSDITLEEMADVLTHRSRKQDLALFKNLLDNKNKDLDTYRERHGIKSPGEEAVWHHFLSQPHRHWIFGLSLDLRFIDNFTNEASIGTANTKNQGNPKADMLAWNDFTVTIELKTPRSLFFTEEKTSEARTNTWSFTTTFIEGYSQALAQKSSWTTSAGGSGSIVYEHDGESHELNKAVFRTIDPCAIFIYGNKQKELPMKSTAISVQTKRDTLERLSRNNRNVTIISFDELYKRAYHIVHRSKREVQNPTPTEPIHSIGVADFAF